MPVGTLLQPSLTSVRLPLARIAHALVDRLIAVVEGGTTVPASGLLLPAMPVVRDSTPDRRGGSGTVT
ncbi:substrate-binding domain-containing protein [Streptomyces sp. NPDC127049]|uniref:substrate-binding domain-containing protein n=1 Tax=Streptomyces sp. NPDC127049 TaxID=3347118 RepID=UPI00365828BC